VAPVKVVPLNRDRDIARLSQRKKNSDTEAGISGVTRRLAAAVVGTPKIGIADARARPQSISTQSALQSFKQDRDSFGRRKSWMMSFMFQNRVLSAGRVPFASRICRAQQPVESALEAHLVLELLEPSIQVSSVVDSQITRNSHNRLTVSAIWSLPDASTLRY
jgi:hypothetical protein